MDELLTEEEVLCLLDGYRSVINTDKGLLKFAEAVQKTQIGKRWRRVFRKPIPAAPPIPQEETKDGNIK